IRSGMLQGHALASRVGTVVRDVGIGPIDSGGWIDGKSRAPSDDRTKLPAACHGIEESIAEVDPATLAYGQVVQAGSRQAMTIVKGREAALAALASAVLPKERVAIRGPN